MADTAPHTAPSTAPTVFNLCEALQCCLCEKFGTVTGRENSVQVRNFFVGSHWINGCTTCFPPEAFGVSVVRDPLCKPRETYAEYISTLGECILVSDRHTKLSFLVEVRPRAAEGDATPYSALPAFTCVEFDRSAKGDMPFDPATALHPLIQKAYLRYRSLFQKPSPYSAPYPDGLNNPTRMAMLEPSRDPGGVFGRVTTVWASRVVAVLYLET